MGKCIGFHQQLQMYGAVLMLLFINILELVEIERLKGEFNILNNIQYLLVFSCACMSLSQYSVLIIFKVTLNEPVMCDRRE